MNKREAARLLDEALNILDLVHCLHTGGANEISFDTWQDMFARGKDYEAARKQWQRKRPVMPGWQPWAGSPMLWAGRTTDRGPGGR